MTSKRAADKQMDHDNWQEEDDTEEAGEFAKASEDELKKRIIKTAKRRMPGGSDPNKPSAFAGFAGFGALNNSNKNNTPAASPFSFLSKIAATNNNNGSSVSAVDSSKSVKDANKSASEDKNLAYYQKIKSLNVSVSDWIKKHVDSDPLCILTPIFKDYEKFLKDIEESKDKSPENDKGDSQTDKDKTEVGKSFSFGLPKTDSSSSISAAVNSSGFGSFKFGATADTTTPANKSFLLTSSDSNVSSKSSFSFGSPITSTQKTELQKSTSPAQDTTVKPIFSGFGSGTGTGFSFGSSQPFSFGNVAGPPAADKKPDEADNENEEPPKNEFVPVVEENSVYSKRCKVFVKQGNDYADRGVGTLYLKKVEDSEKIQCIVRAETSLGNILLNLILTQGLPASRLGKNNVMLVCIPTPESKPPPTSVLLRVKTADEADALLEEIKKYI